MLQQSDDIRSELMTFTGAAPLVAVAPLEIGLDPRVEAPGRFMPQHTFLFDDLEANAVQA